MASNALVRTQDQLDSLRQRFRSQRDRLKTEGKNMIRTAGAVGTGYALGMATAKWGENAVAGMNTALAVGAASTAVALMGVGGEDVQTAARTVGDASLAIYAYNKGFEHQTARDQDAGAEAP